MGVAESKPIAQFTKTDIVQGLSELGEAYSVYSDAVASNGVDGELLLQLKDAEFEETLDDLGITNRLHRRILTKEWKKLRERNEIASTRSSQNGTSIGRTRALLRQKLLQEHPEWRALTSDEPLSDRERRILKSIECYCVNEETGDDELRDFDSIAEAAFEKCGAVYAGVHLIDSEGHLSLASRLMKDSRVSKARLHIPKEFSRCYSAVVYGNDDFVVTEIPCGGSIFNPDAAAKYIGYVAKNTNGDSIGTVCVLLTTAAHDLEAKQEILRELAGEFEKQLEVRQSLLIRNQLLRDQIDESKQIQLLPAFGPIPAVFVSDVEKREKSPFPTLEEIRESGEPPNVAALAIFHDPSQHASAEEMDHLPENYYNACDQLSKPRTPVHKDDMRRSAAVEALELDQIAADDLVGKALKRLSKLAAQVFDVDFVMIAIHRHDKTNTLANYCSASKEAKDNWFRFTDVCSRDQDGEPWLCQIGRSIASCNYVMYTRRTFTSHDVWADESLNFVRKLNLFRFYSSSPIFMNGLNGRDVVATFCIFDFRRPHFEFDEAHQIQQEYFCELVGHQLEIWVLRREMERLEQGRRLLDQSIVNKTQPPSRFAAVVYTDIQGSTNLWEADSTAMQEALVIHDNILREHLAMNHGYEVTTEGDAFHVVFHDCIDAVSFALGIQEALYAANWSDDILSQCGACEDLAGCFRGLRVRVAIHYGIVSSRDNDTSSSREYLGPTVKIAKSLEKMAHGGQILATKDVWNLVSPLSEARFGKPQVIDLGSFALWVGKQKSDGLIEKDVVQLVPAKLSFDYIRCRTHNTSSLQNGVRGRQFLPPVLAKGLSPSFFDAPYNGEMVTILFVCTETVEEMFDDTSILLPLLAKRIATVLKECAGYQCKNFMLAFSSLSSASYFGLKLQDSLSSNAVGGYDLKGLVQVGFHEGELSSMGPNPQTGRADYFGKVANRAARVASATAPGKVYCGVVRGTDPSDLVATFVGRKMLKGIQEEMSLYECHHGDKPKTGSVAAAASSKQSPKQKRALALKPMAVASPAKKTVQAQVFDVDLLGSESLGSGSSGVEKADSVEFTILDSTKSDASGRPMVPRKRKAKVAVGKPIPAHDPFGKFGRHTK